ncbi:Hypothetical protein, putative [Bodo saltans]|uniref:AAA+ ATPase domain-containing protein n=1 Tax=Bodo saltans TaxID=75058 RepID=A0A0S4JJB9_BODSA|nr:Hypothetical protein, putative [Bodo saltans]|eukprot:CUG90391.1 Hypothetical protein, putative [Bodo saltans]
MLNDDAFVVDGSVGGPGDGMGRDAVMNVLDAVGGIVRQLIPPHVYVLGTVPSNEELRYFGFECTDNGHNTTAQRSVYEMFSTETKQRENAASYVVRALGAMGVTITCDGKNLAMCRENGFRVHAMLVNLRNSKERALRCFEDNQEFIMALIAVCANNETGDRLLLKLGGVLASIQVTRSREWSKDFSKAMEEFRALCNSPDSPVVDLRITEACSHFVNGIIMSDKKEVIPHLIEAFLDDCRKQRAVKLTDEEEHRSVIGTTLVLDVKNDNELNDKGKHVVAGERGHKIRQVLTTAMTNFLAQLQKCANTLIPRLDEIAEDEPSIPLPRLQQTKEQSVHSHLRGGCTIVDLGFRSDGCYTVEYRQKLPTIEFHRDKAGPTLGDAIIAVAKHQEEERHGLVVRVVRLTGSDSIGSTRCSITIVCRLPGRSMDSHKIKYETFVDGENISADNPVEVVIATDDRDSNGKPIPFHRIAQHISGTTWRKEGSRRPIADKAVQVAEAVKVDYKIRDQHGEAFTSKFDVMNSVVYQSSKQLLDHLDCLREFIEKKWNDHLNLDKRSDLANILLRLLTEDNVRVVALSNRELTFAREMLDELQFVVKDVAVDNLSFVSKRTTLEDRSKKPSISFVHLELVGHLETANVEQICDLVAESSLRLLVVASPSTQHFAKVAAVVQTPSAAQAFQSTRVTLLTTPILVDPKRFEAGLAAPEVIESVTKEAKRFTKNYVNNFASNVSKSSRENALTIVCRRGLQLDGLEGIEVRDLRKDANPLRAVRESFERANHENIVGILENPIPQLALFVFEEKVVDAHLMFVPKPTSAEPTLTSALGISSNTSELAADWATLQSALSHQGINLAFEDFICVIPECEWLDHRCRVQLYLLIVWGVPFETSRRVLGTIRNVTSLPLPSTCNVTKGGSQRTTGADRSVEVEPSFCEMVVDGTVTMDDVLRSSIAARTDIPWNLCSSQWGVAAPFSSAVLTQVLSVYPYRLRLLVALGPSLFHTLGSVKLFVGDTPLSWAVDVATRLASTTGLLQRELLQEKHLASISVVKWLFLTLGWNDKVNAMDRDQHPLPRIAFDAADFAAVDREGIIMDLLDGHATSKSDGMSAQTRNAIALMLASIKGPPQLFSKQPQVIDYFLRTAGNGGMTTASAKYLFKELLSPDGPHIGAPFLSILKDSTLLAGSALRKDVPEVDELWRWCNGELNEDATEKLQTILSKLSANAWGFLLSITPTSSPERVDALFEKLNYSSSKTGITLSSVLNEASSLGGVEAVSAVILRSDNLEVMGQCHAQDALLDVLKAATTGVPVSNPVKYAKRTPETPSSQFHVELESHNKRLTYSLMQLPFFDGETAQDSDFSVAVLFTGRCLTESGRRYLLRTLTEMLLDTSPVAGDIDFPRPSNKTLELAVAVLWVHLPLAPCPLSTSATTALRRMKAFLSGTHKSTTKDFNEWTQEQIEELCSELEGASQGFRYSVGAEFETASLIALGLIDMFEYLPQPYLQPLLECGIVEDPPVEQVTNIVVQGSDWPTYKLVYSMRPLSQRFADAFFAPGQYVLDTKDPSFDVSHGVSAELVKRNLSYFAYGNVALDAESIAARLCIVLWFQSLGLFAGCHDRDAAEMRLMRLQVGNAALDMAALRATALGQGLLRFKDGLTRHEPNLRATQVVIRTTLPSFMEVQVRRKSSLLKLFDISSSESVLYTLQTLSAVLAVLPKEKQRPSNYFYLRGVNSPQYSGDTTLAHFIHGPHGSTVSDSERAARLEKCFCAISCEIGYRLGQAWSSLDERGRLSAAQSVVNTPFALLDEFEDKGKDMLLRIVDVALEQLDPSSQLLTPAARLLQRAQLCSAVVMSIGFQDPKALECLLYPLLELMGGQKVTLNYDGILNHNRTTVDGKLQRSFLTRRVAREIVYWREAGYEVLKKDAASWIIPLGSWQLALSSIDNNKTQFPPEDDANAATYIVNIAQIAPTDPLPNKSLPPKPTPKAEIKIVPRVFLFRESTPSSAITPVAPSAPAISAPATSRHVTKANESSLHTAIIDVSAILHLVVPENSVVSGGYLQVIAGLGCALLRDSKKQLRVVPLQTVKSSDTICCFFEDYGEAWEFCCARAHPSTLVGMGFMLASSPKGGWRIVMGLAHIPKDTEQETPRGIGGLRPWHMLAFNVVLGLPLHGPSEDKDTIGGPFLLLEWMCRRVCQGLAVGLENCDLSKNTDADRNRMERVLNVETVQELINALVTSDDEVEKSESCVALLAFLNHIADKVKQKQHGSNLSMFVVDADIYAALRAMNPSKRDRLKKCGVEEKMSMCQLREAVGRSLEFISGSSSSSEGSFLASIDPGASNRAHAASTTKLFEDFITHRDLQQRLLGVLKQQWRSDKIAQRLIEELPNEEFEKEYPNDADPSQSDFVIPEGFTTVKHQVDDGITTGTGIQSGDRNDVFFALSKSYNAAELTSLPIERKEKYHQSHGLLLNFLVDKRLIKFPNKQGNEALVVQWVQQVLRSPLPIMWKEWFLLHLHSEALWMPQLRRDDPKSKQYRIIAQLLALRCEMGGAREIVFAAFDELPLHCTRCNRIYGVIAMLNPPVAEWISSGFDVQEHRFTDLPQDEEAFRIIVSKFNPMTTHVVVYGYDKEPMSDTLLKWLCEYTFRYPWRFFIVVNCDTTTNLPENRDRVSNFLPLRNRVTDTVTLPVDSDIQSCEVFIKDLPVRGAPRFNTARSCDWSEEVEKCLLRVQPTNSNLVDRVLLIHLISPPGGGKSTLMQDLERRSNDIGKFVRFDCSDDRLVEEALRALLDEVLAGMDLGKESIVLIADEYHMLPERKKEEFMQWARGKLNQVKIVMIANRADPLDKKLLSTLNAAYPGCERSIKCVEGRISALKVKIVISKTYNSLTPDAVNRQSKKFYTFLATLRGMLGDDAVSLRLEEHFPREDKAQKVNNYEFTKRLQDKLIVFGHESVLRILNSYEQISTNIESETRKLVGVSVRDRICELYKDSIHGSPTKLIVFTSMLVPLLMYEEPVVGEGDNISINAVQDSDLTLCYRDVVEQTGNLRHAPAAVRLALWVRYVLSFVGMPLEEELHDSIFLSLRRLNLVDFPDFPIIQGESSLKTYPLHEQKTTFVNYNDLTDLDWIYRTLSRRAAVNWGAVRRTWEQSPVTDSEKLCTIIDQAGPTTVFTAMTARNVLQLLKRNPTGAFRDAVIKSYPINRIKSEATIDESPYFFATFAHLVTCNPEPTVLQQALKDLVWTPRGGAEERDIAKMFLFWISHHGSMAGAVSDRAQERCDAVLHLVVWASTQLLCLIPKECADLWRGKYLAPVTELFDSRGNILIPVDHAMSIAKGTHAYHRLHDKWPPLMQLLHRIVSSNNTILTHQEATHLLNMKVLQQPPVPGTSRSRLVGALLQTHPPRWLSREHEIELLNYDVVIGANDMNNEDQYKLHACRNVLKALDTLHTREELKLQCASISSQFDVMKRTGNATFVATQGRAQQ